MERIRTVELAASLVGQRVRLAGWLHSLRRLGGVSFLTLRDGRGTAQAVFTAESTLGAITEGGLRPETVLQIEGTVAAAPPSNRAGPPAYELHAPSLAVLSPVTAEPPVALGKRELRAPLPTLLDHAVVANRHPARKAVFRLVAGAMAGFRATLGAQGFTEVQTPKIVGQATEGGANVFELSYFGGPAYLAQSPQFYKQIMVGVFERVFEVGPVFRAEPSQTIRHLAEYVSLDVEMGFIQSHQTVMALLREVLAGIFAELARGYAPELAALGVALPEVPGVIPQLHFEEAQSLITARTGEVTAGEPDLSPAGERALGEWAREAHGSEWLFVTGYPMRKRPFYTHGDPLRPEHSNSFDLLFRGTELVTGGQRLHRYEDYVTALAARGIAREPLEWYLAAFKHGMPPHGGFAIGLERFVMQTLALANVRLVALFPRDTGRLAP